MATKILDHVLGELTIQETVSKPRVKVKAPTRMYAHNVPDDAQPGDLVVGNRGAAAKVWEGLGVLGLEYVGNVGMGLIEWKHGKVYDHR